MKKMGKYGKDKLKNIVKSNLRDLLVFHVTILWLTDFRYRDLGAITKPMQTQKVSEPTFLHQIQRCFGILFDLSGIFDINTNLNENYKEMS
jgi:hypothetical protein